MYEKFLKQSDGLMRKVVTAVILCLLVGAAGWFYFQPAKNYVTINNQRIYVELAADTFSRQRGLSYRDSLAANRGLLFLFPRYDNRFFWMKGMRFPIDIIWIKQGRIIGIKHDVPLSDGPDYPHYISPEPVSKVLEVNAGIAKKLGLQPGQTVNYHIKTAGGLFN